MFGRKRPSVLVVGAGPAGLLGALELAEHGVRVEVIDPALADEASRRRRLKGAVTLLHPSSLALLDGHGVASPLLERAHRVRTIGVYANADRVGELSFGALSRATKSPFPFAALVTLADLDDCIRSALRRLAIEVCYQRRLSRVEQGASRVCVAVDHLGSDSAGYATAHSELVVEKSTELEPDFVLAADGHQSVARLQLGIAFREVRPGERYRVYEGTARQRLPEDAALLFSEGARGAVWPLPGERYRCLFSVPAAGVEQGAPGTEPVSSGRGLDTSLASAWLSEHAPWLASAMSCLEGRDHIEAEYRLASAFGKGRIWLAGGAAHSTSPLSSQSVNVGLREATRLGDIFAGVLRGGEPLEALATYDRERLDEWQRLLSPQTDRHDAPPRAHFGRALARDSITPYLPTSGPDLDVLLGRLRMGPATLA
jgi:2-polyprenyl-6-methoxyphenol hydroxylase-like FAD-dependent oxidoreductase